MSLVDDLKLIAEQANEQLAAAKTLEELEKVRVATMGKKGSLAGVLRSMGSVDPA